MGKKKKTLSFVTTNKFSILAISLWGVIFLYCQWILLLICMILQLMWRKDVLLHGSLENSTDSYLCFQLALLHSVSYFFSSIDHLLRLYTQILMPFHLIQTRFSRSAHLLMSYLIDITRIVNFPNRIPDCDSHSPVLLDFLFFWRCICSTIVSLHWKTLIMLSQFPLTFSSNSKQYAPTGCPVLSYSLWLFSCWVHGLCDHLRDVPWEDIFRDIFVIIWVMLHGRISLSWELLLMQVNVVSEFRSEMMYIFIC